MESTRRQSKKRDAIREILLASYDHPSVEEIYRRLKPDIPDLSLGTVYRNLALFREEGKAMSVAHGRGTGAVRRPDAPPRAFHLREVRPRGRCGRGAARNARHRRNARRGALLGSDILRHLPLLRSGR